MKKLPDYCFSTCLLSGKTIKIIKGEDGYRKCNQTTDARTLNERINVTPHQQLAMELGSMFGWDSPGANPDNLEKYYNEGVTKL